MVMARKHNNSLCLQAIAESRIADIVPLNGQVSFVDIARQKPMTSEMTARLLRHAMTMRVFREPEPGMVAHTAASRVLHHSPANDWLQAGTKEMWPAATKVSVVRFMLIFSGLHGSHASLQLLDGRGSSEVARIPRSQRDGETPNTFE